MEGWGGAMGENNVGSEREEGRAHAGGACV